MMQDVDIASLRLALALDDCRVYVGLAGPDDSLFLYSEGTFGGGGSIGPRETLVTRGARIQWGGSAGGCEIVGIVSDEVIAVHVGSAKAVLANNVFIAVDVSLDDPIVLRTADGERSVQLPMPRNGHT
jgi:hypothetical protein